MIIKEDYIRDIIPDDFISENQESIYYRIMSFKDDLNDEIKEINENLINLIKI